LTTRFSRNVGYLDRLLRFVAGLVLIYIGFVAPQLVGNIVINLFLGLFGALNIVSALTGICLFYTLASISTRKDKKNPL